ncbi:MAG: DUF2157 domain-containing protein [Xanthomonadales bacterium]|nr:DUF2157 domain-containing protein [Gammaproteobacteria bacterium]NNL94727.1 DUF2157 domain-containing protein [Xanthomonadales bacterium]
MNEQADALRQIADIAARHDLTAEQVATALQPSPPPDQRQRSSSVLAKVLAYLGGVFVLAGIALFIGMQWDSFNSAVRVLVTLGTGFAIYLFALMTITDARFSGVTTPMFLVSALLQPTGIVVMLNEYSRGGDPEHGLLFMCAVIFIQQILTFLAKQRTVLLFTSLFFGSAGFGTLCQILDIDFEIVALALGVGLTSVSYAIDKTRHAAITPFWYFAGAVFFLFGAFDVIESTMFEILYFGIASGFMYLGTVLRSRTLLFVAVIALTSFTGYFFRESLVNAFGLIFMGFLLIGLSAFAMKLSRKFRH